MIVLTWTFILLCIVQSGLFSGLTIGLFGLSRLKLEVEADAGSKNAKKILKIRKDSNFLLTTLLWGNVGVNVLIALLTESIMTGVGAFLFSTLAITTFGEIFPQAYFSRHALRIATYLIPMIRFYQILLYPVAKPSAMLLDRWLGKEEPQMLKERALMYMLQKHIDSSKSDIGKTEGIGAINFLKLDDIKAKNEGAIIKPESIVQLPFKGHDPIFPEIKKSLDDPFIKKVQASKKKWTVIVDEQDNPRMVIDADSFVRDALYKDEPFYPTTHCYHPIIVTSPETKMDDVIKKFKVFPLHERDHVIDLDLIIYWNGDQKRIITGSDILGLLLKGIVTRVE
ncbi:DUF21 domain-containing protein [Methanosalsum natronophilum]|uniref:DUF21 domain-containing protein n=1 Tax=Methanosalsum natronophilum TaxID=768733 RepID=UPI0021693080|nr:DUF21 domain-containing protein [Methanosalsum natronophilum]MCS3923565.1 CBS domain containing-hemolysin-like protein [Methanosalsum natronophilum]